MKKTQLIEMFRGFKKQSVVFISIILFVGFGMGAYFGLTWSGDAMEKTVDGYYAEGNLADWEITYVYGLTEEDIRFLKEQENHDEVEGRYESYRLLIRGDDRYRIRILSLTESLDTFTYLEGKKPEKDGEIAVEKAFAEKQGIRAGDVICFDAAKDSDSFKAQLTGEKFTVTAIVKTAEYLSTYADTYGVDPQTGCPVGGIMFAAKEAFSSEGGAGYAGALIRSEQLRGKPFFSKEYRDALSGIRESAKSSLKAHFSEKFRTLTQIPGLSELTDYEYGFVLSTANASFAGVDTLVRIFEELRYSLCGLFVIVGALVCFFAVSRNVYEQTRLIGTKKALGFYNREICASLLLFSALAAAIGILVGTVGARFAVEEVLVEAMKETYAFNETGYVLNLPEALLFGAAEMAVILLSTYLAAASILKRSAGSLLANAKENTCTHRWYMDTKLYRGLSEFAKTIVNNVFSDPRRVFATIVGIMGITALVTSSVSLNDFIQDSFAKNVTEITKYDTVIYLREDEGGTEKIREYLTEKGMPYAEVMSTYVTLDTPDDQHLASSLYVVEDDEKFLRLFDLHEGKNRITSIDGLYSSISYREEYRPGPDDPLMLTDALGREHEFRGVTYFDYSLIRNQFVMDRKSYEEEFGEEYRENAILLLRGNTGFGSLREDLSGYDGIAGLSDYYGESKESFDGFAAVFSLVVGVYILLAVLMAFIVVMNLIVMFIQEKKIELIVLMINGFSRKDAKRYIYSDTIVLTVIGTVCGLILGTVMGNISLRAYRTATLYFPGGVDRTACLAGVGITVLLTVLVSLFSLRAIDRLTLSDINRA